MTNSSSFTVNNSLYKVLVEPTKTFYHLKHSPSILRPFLLVSFAGILMTVAVYPYILEDITRILEIETSLFAIILFAATAIFICGLLITEWTILSALIYFAIVTLSKELPNFKTVLSCVGYSWMPIIFKTLAFAVLVFFSGHLLEPKGFAALFPDIHNRLLDGLLRQIDLFVIWHFIILLFCIKVLLADKHWIKPFVIMGIPHTLLFLVKIIPYLI